MSSPFDHLSDRLELLHEQCLRGLQHFRMWRLIGNKMRESEILRKNFPFFFIMTRVAHLASTTLYANRVYDKSGDAVRLEEILQFAESHLTAFRNADPGEVERLVSRSRERLSEVQDKIENLREQRNNRFAHLSKEYLGRYDELFSEYPLEYRDTYDLLQLAADILNDLRGALEDGDAKMDRVEERQTTQLMDLIEETMEERQRKSRREAERKRHGD